MLIKWSAVKVSENVDELDELVRSISTSLWRITDKARDIKQIPNLPGYIDQPTNTLLWKVDAFKDYLKGYIERIRERIPQDALKEERKAMEYGSQQSLI